MRLTQRKGQALPGYIKSHVHPDRDPISGMHCWHQAVRVRPASTGDLVGALLPPVRSGIILTRHRLADASAEAGVGYRIGERRFTLRAMIEQDPAATLSWLAAESGRWARRHASRAAGGGVSQLWCARAAGTIRVLRELAARTSMSRRPAGVSVP